MTTVVEDLARTLLGTAHESLGSPPDRQYIAHEQPVHDCAQLTVSLVTVRAQEFDDPRKGRCAVVPVAVYRVALVGCVPGPDAKGRAPKPEAITEASSHLMGEAWRMWKGVASARKVAAFGDCRNVTLGELLPLESSGGLAGYQLDVEIVLTGTHEES